MNIKEKVGQRIRELREEKNFTQEELGHIADIDRTYINGVENGKRNISIENLEKIANALDIEVYKLFIF